MEKTKWVSSMGLLLAFALLLGYVESLLPLPFWIPGMKLGLANLAVLLALYLMGWQAGLLLNLLRILLCGFLFGNLYSILYSLAGGLFSFCMMLLIKRIGGFGIGGVSLAGGAAHNLGQLAVAALVVETGGLFYYLPPLLIMGVLTGMVNGMVAEQVLKRVKRQQ